jgi:hypothetical protein
MSRTRKEQEWEKRKKLINYIFLSLVFSYFHCSASIAPAAVVVMRKRERERNQGIFGVEHNDDGDYDDDGTTR